MEWPSSTTALSQLTSSLKIRTPSTYVRVVIGDVGLSNEDMMRKEESGYQGRLYLNKKCEVVILDR
jgi:hypothetical protein